MHLPCAVEGAELPDVCELPYHSLSCFCIGLIGTSTKDYLVIANLLLPDHPKRKPSKNTVDRLRGQSPLLLFGSFSIDPTFRLLRALQSTNRKAHRAPIDLCDVDPAMHSSSAATIRVVSVMSEPCGTMLCDPLGFGLKTLAACR